MTSRLCNAYKRRVGRRVYAWTALSSCHALHNVPRSLEPTGDRIFDGPEISRRLACSASDCPLPSNATAVLPIAP
jgi:hypothetical protein